jgi:O-succinylhomoserine sulfhydrylase
MGGVILSSEKFIQDNIHNLLRQTGPAMSPFNAWVLLKGLETLSLRVARQTATATAIADLLATHPKITRLVYPGRADHPQAATVKKQMRGGSTLIAFEIAGGKPAAFRFLNALTLVKMSNNLGDAKTLITHPATTTHQRLTPEARAELGITESLVRLSAGLEHPDDLAADITMALEKA